MNQIRIADWPSNLIEEIVVLKEEFCDLPKITFEEGSDDLDYFQAAIVAVDEVNRFALKKYKNCPSGGLGLFVQTGTPTDMLEQLDTALDAIGLDHRSIIWMRPGIK